MRFSIITFMAFLLAACGPAVVSPMYSPVNTQGNVIQADTGPAENDLNDEFCPPGEASKNNC